MANSSGPFTETEGSLNAIKKTSPNGRLKSRQLAITKWPNANKKLTVVICYVLL